MNGVKTVSRATAVDTATKFDVIAAQGPVFTSHLADMRAANPDLVVLGYVNSTFTWRTNLPDDWYAKDSAGRRIFAKGWSQTYLMNPAHPAYVDWVSSTMREVLETTRYDGIFLDVLGVAPLDPNYVSALPVHPITGLAYSKAEWTVLTTALATITRTSLSSVPVVGNGLMYGPQYFSPTGASRQIMSSGMHGGMAEAFVRPAGSPIDSRRTELSWKQDVEMMLDSQATGQSIFAVTKSWTAATPAQKRDRHVFALATYLLGNDGSSFFHYTYESGDAGVGSDLDSLNLGSALGGYTSANAVYQRSFSAGKVFVNVGKTAVTVSLGATYRAVDGTTGTTFTVPAYGSVILQSA